MKNHDSSINLFSGCKYYASFDRELNSSSTWNLNITGTTVSTIGILIEASIVPGSSILTDTTFQPNPVSIKIGGTVRWINDDNVIHTVIEGNPATVDLPEKGFDSELMSTDQAFDHRFNQTGNL